MRPQPQMTPAALRRLLTFRPATATVQLTGECGIQPADVRVSYYYYEELFRQVHQLHLARGFQEETITVTLHDGRRFEWDGLLALQCFTRRNPRYDKLMALVPQIETRWM